MLSAGGIWYDWAGPDNGRPLVLSSGLGGSASYWEPNLAALTADHRVLLYDHRGTGRSDRALPEQVSIAGMASDVLGLLGELGLDPREVDFIGHAIGGLIGLDIAFRTGLRRLVVVNGWDEIDPHTLRCFEARLALLRNSGAEAFVRAQPIFLFPANWITAHEDLLAEQERGHLSHFPGAANVEKRIAAAQAFRLPAGSPSARILALAAEDDILVPSRRSEVLADRLGGAAELNVIDRGGHACNVTNPETFNRIVTDFLGS